MPQPRSAKARMKEYIRERLARFKEPAPERIAPYRYRAYFPLHPGPPKLMDQPGSEEGPIAQLASRGIRASLPEAIVYIWLERNKIDFTFQEPFMGGRSLPGGAVVDFIIMDRQPPLLIRIQGEYWHSDPGQSAKDEESRIQLERLGYTVVDIWDTWVQKNVEYAMRLALSGVELGR